MNNYYHSSRQNIRIALADPVNWLMLVQFAQKFQMHVQLLIAFIITNNQLQSYALAGISLDQIRYSWFSIEILIQKGLSFSPILLHIHRYNYISLHL